MPEKLAWGSKSGTCIFNAKLNMGIFTGSDSKESKDLVLQVGSQTRPCLLNASHHHYFPSQHKRKLKSLIGNPNSTTEQTFATRWSFLLVFFSPMYIYDHLVWVVQFFLYLVSYWDCRFHMCYVYLRISHILAYILCYVC